MKCQFAQGTTKTKQNEYHWRSPQNLTCRTRCSLSLPSQATTASSHSHQELWAVAGWCWTSPPPWASLLAAADELGVEASGGPVGSGMKGACSGGGASTGVSGLLRWARGSRTDCLLGCQTAAFSACSYTFATCAPECEGGGQWHFRRVGFLALKIIFAKHA